MRLKRTRRQVDDELPRLAQPAAFELVRDNVDMPIAREVGCRIEFQKTALGKRAEIVAQRSTILFGSEFGHRHFFHHGDTEKHTTEVKPLRARRFTKDLKRLFSFVFLRDRSLS